MISHRNSYLLRTHKKIKALKHALKVYFPLIAGGGEEELTGPVLTSGPVKAFGVLGPCWVRG